MDKRYLCDIINFYAEEALDKTYTESTRLSMMPDGVCISPYGTKVFMISGGLNGPGKWNEYLQTLAMFVVELEDMLKFNLSEEANVYLVNIKNDCCDDVFYAVFGVSLGEDIDETESIEWLEDNTWQFDEGEEVPFEYDTCTEDWSD